jgi:hypothetical protein
MKNETISITLEDNERLQNDLDEIVSNNVDHHNEMYENFDHSNYYYLLNLKTVVVDDSAVYDLYHYSNGDLPDLYIIYIINLLIFVMNLRRLR